MKLARSDGPLPARSCGREARSDGPLPAATMRQRGSKSNPVAGQLRPRCGAPWQIRTAREAPHGPL